MTDKNEQMMSEPNPNTPISKRCKRCKQVKLFSDFDFSSKSKDKRAATCKSCMEERGIICEGPPHTNTCIIEKTLTVMYYELDCFLARCQ